MYKTILILISGLFFSFNLISQETVTFKAPDGLEITANLYELDETLPYIVLFHQANSSKGEYKEIAIKLLKLGYNCLAVDLRSGDNFNFVQNETAIRAKKQGLPTGYLDAEQDILAAIEWTWERSKQNMIVFGSSYSASLCLKIAKNESKIKAVIAFSPGEYFLPKIKVADELKGYLKPTFIASSKHEFKYVDEMFTEVPKDYKTIFQPQEGDGVHGAKALFTNSETHKEYWLALFLFFKTIN